MPLIEFGKLLDHTWKLKRGIGTRVSTDGIDGLYEKALKAGATGGKLLGAGGGGFLLFYVERERQENVASALSELMRIPFAFEEGGSRVIYFDPEHYEI
jgi:D-glycero-alpha-D-manno-heptose-7-phosphate kinase